MAFAIKLPANIEGGPCNYKFTSASNRACDSFIRRKKSSVKMCSSDSGETVQRLEQAPAIKAQEKSIPIMVPSC